MELRSRSKDHILHGSGDAGKVGKDTSGYRHGAPTSFSSGCGLGFLVNWVLEMRQPSQRKY